MHRTLEAGPGELTRAHMAVGEKAVVPVAWCRPRPETTVPLHYPGEAALDRVG